MATDTLRPSGLLDLMGQGDSAFAGWLNPRRNALTQFGAGLIGADSARDAMRGAAQGLVEGQRADTAFALLQEERAREREALQQQQAQKNATIEFLQQQNPMLAQMVSAGMPVSDAFRFHLDSMKVGGGDMTADQRNFLMAQENPEFAKFLGIGEAEMTDTIRNLEFRAQQAGLQPGTPEYQNFMASGGSGGMALSVGPDGTVQFVQGSAKPLTEVQSKDTVYATRANGANKELEGIDTQLTNPVARAVEGDPTGVARGALQSADFQEASRAGKEFLASILRKDTGAAVTPSEEQMYGQMYLPQPGDTPEVIEAKRQARIRAIAAIEAGMPPQAILNMEKALQQTGGASGAGYTILGVE